MDSVAEWTFKMLLGNSAAENIWREVFVFSVGCVFTTLETHIKENTHKHPQNILRSIWIPDRTSIASSWIIYAVKYDRLEFTCKMNRKRLKKKKDWTTQWKLKILKISFFEKQTKHKSNEIYFFFVVLLS